MPHHVDILCYSTAYDEEVVFVAHLKRVTRKQVDVFYV
jgi:hypothetical protein